jgi:hypothetical protein
VQDLERAVDGALSLWCAPTPTAGHTQLALGADQTLGERLVAGGARPVGLVAFLAAAAPGMFDGSRPVTG